MKHMDPAKAARVWQRVQDSLKQSAAPACQKLPPLPVYTTPPDAWQHPAARPKRSRSQAPCGQYRSSFPWTWLLVLILLLSQKTC